MRSLSVLHITKASGVAGSERHLLSLLPRLSAEGLDVSLCVLSAPGADRLSRAARELGIGVTEVAAGPHFNPALFLSLRKRLRALGPDLVHTHLIHADIYGQLAAASLGIPSVSTLHSWASFYRRGAYRRLARFAARLSELNIAISEHVGRAAADTGLVPYGKVRVIRYGISPERWPIDREQHRDARSRFGITQGSLVVGVASRLVPFKGHDLLIDAFSEVLRNERDVTLLIAGEGPLRSSLEQKVRTLGMENWIRFLGHVEDVRLFFAACDVFVIPSSAQFGEGFGLAALEAMISGLPVIATDIHPFREVVGTDQGGILVPPKARAFASAITALVGDETKRRQLGTQARERAMNVFSLDHMVAETLGVYTEVLGSHPPVHSGA